jgi:hypothetical protein
MFPNIMIKEVAMNYKLNNMLMKKHSGAFNPLKDIWTAFKQTESGRKLHDSILIIRPGLMDSIRMLKEIYNSQIK